MLLKKQILSQQNLNNAYLSKTDTNSQTIASNLTVGGGAMSLKNSYLTDTANPSYLRIDPQGNTVIVYDGVNNQMLKVYSSSGNESVFITTVNQASNQSYSLIEVEGASVSRLSINTGYNKPVLFGTGGIGMGIMPNGNQLHVLRNTAPPDGNSYANGHIQARTDNGSLPMIGLHRGGHTAIALYHPDNIDPLKLVDSSGNYYNVGMGGRKNATQLNDHTNLASGIYSNTGDGLFNPDWSTKLNNDTTAWYHVYHSRHIDNNGFAGQIAICFSSPTPSNIGRMYTRTATGTTWNAWQEAGGGGGGSNAKQFSTIGGANYSYGPSDNGAGVWVTALNITGAGILEKLSMTWAYPNGGASAKFDTIFRVIVDGVTIDYGNNINGISYYHHMIYVSDGTVKDVENQGNQYYAGSSGVVMEPITFKSSLVVQLFTKSYSVAQGGYASFSPNISWRYRL